MAPRVLIYVGEQSRLSVISSVHSSSRGGHWINQVNEIMVGETATVDYTQIAYGVPYHCCYFNALRPTLKKGSSFRCIEVNSGSNAMHHDYHIEFHGENGESSLETLSLLKNRKESHTHMFIDHIPPFCCSRQCHKNVLRDCSRCSFEGKIRVRREAQKTEAAQVNHNLLLDDRARAQSRPSLEILADDVRVSHGATIGQLDADQLFYFKARGFSDRLAKNMLIYGFCKEIIEKIPLPSLRQAMRSKALTFFR